MKTLIKTALLAGAAWGALAAPTWAQDAAETAAERVEEVLVTARRVEESLQRAPLAVTAFSGQALERLGATNVTDLQGSVPNLNLVQGRASSNAANIYIRGVGQPDALQTFDPAVGVYVDDVYLSRIRGAQLDLLDLQRVEVLRGPQGTLYGKNTIGGALKLVSRRPDQTFRARGSLAVGDYDMVEAQAAVSGGVAEGVAIGISALSSQRGGYVTDPLTGAEYNDKNTRAARVTVALDPIEKLDIDLALDWSQDDAGLTVGQATNTLTNGVGGVLLAIPNPPPEFNFKTSVTPGTPNMTKLTHQGLSARLAYQVSDALTLKSITAYRELRTDDWIDFDATQLSITEAYVEVDQEQFSQEFQAAYEQGPISAVAGLYYLKEEVVSNQAAVVNDWLRVPAFLNTRFLRTIDDSLETTSLAAYANVSYSLTEQLRVSAGLRYTEEEKDYRRSTSTFYSTLPGLNATYAFKPPTAKFDDTSPMISVDYQVAPDAMVYARYAKGFKSGGYNGRANTLAESTRYDPETATTFEVGAKTSWLENRLRANVAVFTNTYEDFQARVSGTDFDPVTNLPLAVLSVINAGELDIKGAELELVAVPVRNLTLDAQIGYLDAEYGEFKDARFTSFGGSRAFQTPAFSPKWTARYAAQYVADLGAHGDLAFGGAARFRSKMALAVDNTAANSAVELPGMFQDDYWLFDARVVWTDPSARHTVGLYGQNLSDEVYKTDAQEFSSVGGIRTAYYGAPRTWMVKVTAKY